MENLRSRIPHAISYPRSYYEEHCDLLLSEGGADYDGPMVNVNTVLSILLGLEEDAGAHFHKTVPSGASQCASVMLGIYSHGTLMRFTQALKLVVQRETQKNHMNSGRFQNSIQGAMNGFVTCHIRVLKAPLPMIFYLLSPLQASEVAEIAIEVVHLKHIYSMRLSYKLISFAVFFPIQTGLFYFS